MALPPIWYGTQANVLIHKVNDSSNSIILTAEITESDISGGERDVEDLKTLGNNVISRELPAEQMEVNFTALARDIIYREGWSGNYDSSFPKRITGTNSTRTPYRIVFVWKDGSNLTAGAILGTIAGPVLRYAFHEAYITNVEESVDAEGYLQADVTFKFSADANFNDTTSNYKAGFFESSDTSGTSIPALPVYAASGTV